MVDNVIPMRPGGGLPTGSGSGYDGGMSAIEARVERLEGDVKEIKSDLKAVGRDVARIDGKLSNMPTTFQLVSWFIGIAIGLVALVFTIARVMK